MLDIFFSVVKIRIPKKHEDLCLHYYIRIIIIWQYSVHSKEQFYIADSSFSVQGCPT